VKASFVGGLVILLMAGALACGALAVPMAESKVGCESLAHRLPHLKGRLPVAIAVATPCGQFLVERSGAVVRSRPPPRPVPVGAGWYPADLTWYRVVRGHLLIGVRHRFLWRSARPLATRYNVGAIVRGHGRIAFSLFYENGSASKLFVARLGNAEQLIGRGETPIGWTSTGDLVAARFQQLRAEDRAVSRWVLLAPSGRRLRRIAVDVSDWGWAENQRVLYLIARGQVERFDGSSLVALASLASLRIGAATRLTPLGRLLAVSDTKRIALLDARTGAVIATARLPREKERQSYGAIVADASGTAVAFTWNNLAAASSDPSVKGVFDTVYLLRAHAQTAAVLQRVSITYPSCDEMSSLVWRGQSLVYTETGGHALIFRPLTSSPPIRLTPLIARLSGDYVAEPIDFTVRR
jgi:hypothetical protein